MAVSRTLLTVIDLPQDDPTHAEAEADARALINEPDLLLADEPTGSVDTATGKGILDVFAELVRDRHMTAVVITHNDEVAALADRSLRIVDGALES